MSEWRQLSEVDQRAAIRSGYTPIEDLSAEVRAEVEEMLAHPRSDAALLD